MKSKPKDKKYCGVSLEKIQSAEPIFNKGQLKLLNKYITERYRIHVKKDVQQFQPPFTKNPILKEFKFTNIRREHDRETKWLIDNITNNDFLTYRQKLLNCILFRLYNKHESLEIIGAPIKFEGLWTFVPPREKIVKYSQDNPKYVWFTNAFITGGMKLILKKTYTKETIVAALPLRLMKTLNDFDFFNKIQACNGQNQVYDVLKGVDGIGDFLAYQIFVDFTYIDEFPFSENEFTVAGPGCKKGLDYLFEDKDGMSYEECLFWLRDNWNSIPIMYGLNRWFDPEEEMVDLKRYDRVMNVMSLENCFCEFSKYHRAYHDIGRPRNKYKFDSKKKPI